MTDSPDERAKVDRTRDPEDPARDAREEYTGYRDKDSDGTPSESDDADEEARREAGLQPGSSDSDVEAESDAGDG